MVGRYNFFSLDQFKKPKNIEVNIFLTLLSFYIVQQNKRIKYIYLDNGRLSI